MMSKHKTVTYNTEEWKLVPVEPDEKMIDATFSRDPVGDYKAMLAAAPEYIWKSDLPPDLLEAVREASARGDRATIFNDQAVFINNGEEMPDYPTCPYCMGSGVEEEGAQPKQFDLDTLELEETWDELFPDTFPFNEDGTAALSAQQMIDIGRLAIAAHKRKQGLDHSESIFFTKEELEIFRKRVTEAAITNAAISKFSTGFYSPSIVEMLKDAKPFAPVVGAPFPGMDEPMSEEKVAELNDALSKFEPEYKVVERQNSGDGDLLKALKWIRDSPYAHPGNMVLVAEHAIVAYETKKK